MAALALLVAGASLGSAQTITEFLIPTDAAGAQGITVGPDGKIWFTESSGNKIGRLTPTGLFGVFDEFPVPTSGSYPHGITVGPDGNLWFTEHEGNKIGRITPEGVITEFAIPTPYSSVYGIAAGPDGNVWFTEFNSDKIGRLTPAGVLAEFPLPTGASGPYGIAAGPDGNLWFTENSGGRIGRISPAGVITEFDVPTPYTHPYDIAAGPDGNLWFTEVGSNKIGRMTPAGVLTEFPTPATLAYGPYYITSGPGGNLWFSDANSIGKITTTGAVTLSALLPSPYHRYDMGIATDSDGTVWFTEGSKIGRFVPPGVAMSFYTVKPCRAFDSRGTSTPLAAGSQTAVPLVGRCGVSTGTMAVAVNVTVTGATTAGNISLFAAGQRPLPQSSTLNYVAEQTRANNAMAPLGASGATAVYVNQASGSVHVVLDVVGYFVPDSAPPKP